MTVKMIEGEEDGKERLFFFFIRHSVSLAKKRFQLSFVLSASATPYRRKNHLTVASLLSLPTIDSANPFRIRCFSLFEKFEIFN